ncbi:MAG: CoB--CoM heterodisulfide reductase iron-sulfur subunit B family protein [Desulfosarcinaceae bacterium]
MNYLYYPGCSLQGTAVEYDVATRAFLQAVGAELTELEDWTCCGATAAQGISRLLSIALPARNLALAERMQPHGDLLVPCSACYLNLKAAGEEIKKSAELRETVNAALAVEGLSLTGGIRVRHLLDVLSGDLDPARLAEACNRSLSGVRVAPYYGCQCLRPFEVFDNGEAPRSMEPLLSAVGAQIHPWTMGPKCCGASHMNTKMPLGLALSGDILEAARGADVIATVCPMCQMNLEAYQKKISRQHGLDLSISVVYLPQLLGLALGLAWESVGLDRNLAVGDGFRSKLDAHPSAGPAEKSGPAGLRSAIAAQGL